MLSEFDLIARYFAPATRAPARVPLGIGDDCALMQVGPGMQLAVSTDMLVEGRHFFPASDPLQLGHKSLAVNLSDLAAMGARPLAFTLALALPQSDPAWLAPFSRGLLALADRHDCPLIGGDTTRGPLTICITVFGEVTPGAALRRDGACAGDDIWISGTLGDARLALGALRAEPQLDPALLDQVQMEQANARLHAPTPRIALGLALRGVAHAAIDVSDGLIGDLGHILARSHCGATLDVDALPCGSALAAMELGLRRRFALAGGDDYELCFTAPAGRRAQVLAAAQTSNTPVCRIGRIEERMGLRLIDSNGQPVLLDLSSFDHFASP